MSKKILSKSRLQKGFQCPKYLALSVFKPELEAEVGESQEKLFEEGTRVGELARKEFPGGILIEGKHFDYDGFAQKTEAAMADGAKVIFEASFRWRSFFFRADILKKAPKDSWDIIEVKMSNSVKKEHLSDLAIQRAIMEGAGYKIRKTILMHLNGECKFPDLSNLFVQDDVTEKVEAIFADAKKEMLKFEKLIESAKIPKVDIGSHCDAPYECGFKAHCWKHVPTTSIFDIPKLKPWKYYEKNILTLQELSGEKLSESIQIFIQSHLKKKRYVDKAAIKAEMKDWKWPLTLLDFETISYTIPRLLGTSPYSQVPFQLACSVWEKPSAKPKEMDFLDVETEDPREAIAKHLAENLPAKGSVVAYNKGFEARVIASLAKQFPKYKKKLESIVDRLVDPWPVVKAAVYDPGFGSSYSLKYVAPALLGEEASYEDMDVGDGSAAQLAYLKIREGNITPKEKRELTEALIAYCRKDTEVMRQLVEWLYSQT